MFTEFLKKMIKQELLPYVDRLNHGQKEIEKWFKDELKAWSQGFQERQNQIQEDQQELIKTHNQNSLNELTEQNKQQIVALGAVADAIRGLKEKGHEQDPGEVWQC